MLKDRIRSGLEGLLIMVARGCILEMQTIHSRTLNLSTTSQSKSNHSLATLYYS